MQIIKEAHGQNAFLEYKIWRENYENTPPEERPDILISNWPGESSDNIAESAKERPWQVKKYVDLVDNVAFLASVNYRWLLFFRGQSDRNNEPLPVILRSSWKCLNEDPQLTITDEVRMKYWQYLNDQLGPQVAEICRREVGAPDYWHIQNVREAQWAVIQHYGLWPTPLIDLTLNLRVAASFALYEKNKKQDEKKGYVFVFGMPDMTGSVGYDVRERIVLARLQSACPPVAKRPHYQEGFLAGYYPTYDLAEERLPKLKEESNLNRRLIAIFELDDSDSRFWTPNFPPVKSQALYPNRGDLLYKLFKKRFGKKKKGSLQKVAQSFSGL